MTQTAGPTPVRWGIVGTGRMADAMANELNALAPEGARLVAVASRTDAAAKAFATRHNLRGAFVGAAALAADPLVDVVYIATPPAMHASDAIACLEAGKAVLCEKSFTVNAEEARLVAAAASSSGQFAMEAMWTRFLPSMVMLRAMLREGAIGDVRMIVAGGGFIPDYDPNYYLFDKALGGGVLLDAGVYLVSLASMILGAPTRVLASGEIGRGGVDEQNAVVLEHAGGRHAMLYVSLKCRRAPDLEILGSEGRIRVDAPIFRPARFVLSRPGQPDEPFEFAIERGGYGYQLIETMQAVRAGRPQSEVMPLAESVRIMQTMDEIRRQIPQPA